MYWLVINGVQLLWCEKKEMETQQNWKNIARSLLTLGLFEISSYGIEAFGIG